MIWIKLYRQNHLEPVDLFVPPHPKENSSDWRSVDCGEAKSGSTTTEPINFILLQVNIGTGVGGETAVNDAQVHKSLCLEETSHTTSHLHHSALVTQGLIGSNSDSTCCVLQLLVVVGDLWPTALAGDRKPA